MDRHLGHTGRMALDQFDLPTTYVDTPAKLEEAIPHWQAAGLVSVDIECSLTGVHHCVMALMQIATHDQAWLVDPLPMPDAMKPALEAMAQVPWIVHDFSGDGVVFKRLYDVVPDSVMDTMLLSRALGYPQPGLKTMARLKLGIDIPKEEQDSNWMLRPLRDTQISYASRDAALLLPLLRILADEAEAKADDPEAGPRLAAMRKDLRTLIRRIRAYRPTRHDPVVDKVRHLGDLAVERALKLTALRRAWGNEGDVAAVMELGNRWLMARLAHPPATQEALERTIPNPRFRRKRGEALWEVFRDGAHETQEDADSSDGLIWNNAGSP